MNNSALNEDQRAIVTAKSQGDFHLDQIIASMRSCFPDLRAKGGKTRTSAAAYLVDEDADSGRQHDAAAGQDRQPHDSMVFDDAEAFLGENGVVLNEEPSGSNEVFTEEETMEISAASWKENC